MFFEETNIKPPPTKKPNQTKQNQNQPTNQTHKKTWHQPLWVTSVLILHRTITKNEISMENDNRENTKCT